MRRAGSIAAAAAVGSAWAAAPAEAHGLVGKQDLPIPTWLFVWAACVVLVASFVALASLWPTPRLQEPRERTVLRLPALLEPLCGALGVAAFAFVVYAGFAGAQDARTNILPTVVYVVFWVGTPIASLLLGDVFRVFNPWRATGRAVGWLAKRLGGDALPDPLAYPARLGYWPAALGILAFVWIELAWAEQDVPSALAGAALLYAALQLVGMSLFGVAAWSDRGDAFGVYFGLFARLSPIHWTGGELRLRRPLSGAPGTPVLPGLVALLCFMIGTTSFDGLTLGPSWSSAAPWLQDRFRELGFDAGRANELVFTVGLLAGVGVIFGFYRLGARGMRSVGGDRSTEQLARLFAHGLIPIALAYVIAHYFGLLVSQGQAIGYLVSDPLGRGWDVFGTAGASIDYGWISASAIWYVQVLALVVGHVAGLALAHDRALVAYDSPRAATQSQYWMLAVMVGFTSLALWLLSAGA